ncbi:hypothetical protein C8F04DRAFT_332728 [Mycena alexandri]|uniref:Uncharacterized protein n=1 Tax=Mycena alexandri TaxID=1745969 RepID=A0AAD6T3C5_9AGAR|nr:hypothetical protein C8F04DRAFT_332728 [Mycena alexandri]
MLTHVVMPDLHFVSDACTHASVRWLDHWSVNIQDAPHNVNRTFPYFPSLEGHRLLDCALRATVDNLPLAIDPRVRGDWRMSFPGLAIEQVAEPDGGVSRLQSGDLRAADNWDLSFFGAMETNAVRREQEYFDFGGGLVEHHPFPADSQDEPPPLANIIWAWWKAAEDVTQDEPCGELHNPDRQRAWCWLENETDDEESDLETEYLTDLDDEFYQRAPAPSVPPSYPPTPASLCVRSSFPWFSAALQNSLFPVIP